MARSRTERITIIQHIMLIGVIIGGMIIGYLVGMYIVDRYINEGNEEVNNDYSLHSQSKVKKPQN